MRVNALLADNYRNLEHVFLEPDPGVNVIYGENAQGKTNLLESIWMFTGCRSFRGTKDAELVNFGEPGARLQLNFFAQEREQTASLLIEKRRSAALNGVKLPAANRLMGNFAAVVFAPVHLSLVQSGPAERRKFLDMALCQLRPRYANLLTSYNHTLLQRNALLKDIVRHSELLDTLDVWDDRLAAFGASIIFDRINYVKKLRIFADKFYAGLSRGRESFDVNYLNQFAAECKDVYELKDLLVGQLKNSRKDDIYGGSTSVGPHRDDLIITVDGKSARTFGSQGQKRSCALSLKLSEAAVVKDLTGEQPVALLDDVMSELDSSRQDYILNHIDGWQVFITCCEPSTMLRLRGGKSFEMEGGKLKNGETL